MRTTEAVSSSERDLKRPGLVMYNHYFTQSSAANVIWNGTLGDYQQCIMSGNSHDWRNYYMVLLSVFLYNG